MNLDSENIVPNIGGASPRLHASLNAGTSFGKARLSPSRTLRKPLHHHGQTRSAKTVLGLSTISAKSSNVNLSTKKKRRALGDITNQRGGSKVDENENGHGGSAAGQSSGKSAGLSIMKASEKGETKTMTSKNNINMNSMNNNSISSDPISSSAKSKSQPHDNGLRGTSDNVFRQLFSDSWAFDANQKSDELKRRIPVYDDGSIFSPESFTARRGTPGGEQRTISSLVSDLSQLSLPVFDEAEAEAEEPGEVEDEDDLDELIPRDADGNIASPEIVPCAAFYASTRDSSRDVTTPRLFTDEELADFDQSSPSGIDREYSGADADVNKGNESEGDGSDTDSTKNEFAPLPPLPVSLQSLYEECEEEDEREMEKGMLGYSMMNGWETETGSDTDLLFSGADAPGLDLVVFDEGIQPDPTGTSTNTNSRSD